ncbi:DDE-type integrase/transposase/recombinase [Patescibacteria group bacterium]|nr:DDE-type integrase/transposase/recombinase [Patescibacteria group bacterium]
MEKEILEDRFSQLRFLDKGLISLNNTAANLKLSTRQVQRLLKELKDNRWNLNVLLPKTRGGWNKRDELRKKVILLHKQRPQRSNPAICDLLKEKDIQISPATVRRIRIENNLYKEVKIEKRYFKRFEAKKFGHLLQMDTTEGYWLKGSKAKLILILDDYSRAILAFNWAEQDTTWNNMVVLRSVIVKYGLPAVIYTDNDSKFRVIRNKRSNYSSYQTDKNYETEIKRALRELGIALVNHPPYQAFCKGKVERLFRFIQGRFIPEIKARNFKELNLEFGKWVEWYNQNHINRMTGTKPKERFNPNGFKPLSGKEDLDFILSLREERKIDKYNSFSLNGKQYYLKSKEPFWGQRMTLALNPDHRIRVYNCDKFIQEFKIN